jgi:hypothetical protein
MSQLLFRDPVLQLATALFASHNYDLNRIELPESGDELLVAENSLFTVGVVIAEDLPHLLAIEVRGSAFLADRMDTARLRARIWDVYLVMLTRGELPDDREAAALLIAVLYNTRQIRRIVRTGVREQLESVQEALSPFLPLPSLTDSRIMEDPLDLVQNELVAAGMEPTLAARAVAAFRQEGSLRHV